MSLKKYKYKYIEVDNGDGYGDAVVFESNWPHIEDNFEYIADDAGDCDWIYYNGWESSWPQTFQIWTEDGQEIGIFEVNVEQQPVFRSKKKETVV